MGIVLNKRLFFLRKRDEERIGSIYRYLGFRERDGGEGWYLFFGFFVRRCGVGVAGVDSC